MSANDQDSPSRSPIPSGSPLPPSAMPPEISRNPRRPVTVVILSVLGMLLLIAGIAALKARQISQAIAMGKAFKMPPDTVTSLVVREATVDPSLAAVGSLDTPQGVMMAADLPGAVKAILFESGSHVTNGQVLVQLDVRQEEAQLRTALAKLELDKQNLDRALDLGNKNVIAKSAYDDAKSQYDAALASADEIRAVIGRKTIVAPFEGEAGIRQVNPGQYLKSGDPVVQLESLDPIYVNFALPQQDMPKLRVGQKVRIQADGMPGHVFDGKITAINSAVDPSTRNIQVQATVPNPSHILKPGMFAGVEAMLPERRNVIMIPASSIQYAPYGDAVFVLRKMKDAEGKEYLGASQQTVSLGRTRGDQVEVLEGLRDGDEIATSAIFKLRDKGAVRVNNSVQPGNDPAPKPEDS